MGIPYKDLVDLPEDERISIIGRYAMTERKVIAVCVDAEPGKADRYIEKFKKGFPGIRILGTLSGPVDNVVTIQVGPPIN